MGLLERIAKVRAAIYSESEHDEQREASDSHNHQSWDMESPEEPSLHTEWPILRIQSPVSATAKKYFLFHIQFILFNV